jgi:hypothetical protein
VDTFWLELPAFSRQLSANLFASAKDERMTYIPLSSILQGIHHSRYPAVFARTNRTIRREYLAQSDIRLGGKGPSDFAQDADFKHI